jgi:predicted dithiol-disulfide oxidoreductase (DUF899 family)
MGVRAVETASSPASGHRVVSRDQWIKEREAILVEEKALTHRREELSKRVRNLPWVRIDKNYAFEGPTGPQTLAGLFGPHSQLVVYHFMFDPTWSKGCKNCAFVADHYNPLVVHLAHRDVSFVTVSRAPIEKLESFRKRMGWTFPWVSSDDFGRDFGVTFTDQELTDGGAVYNYNQKPSPVREHPGVSVFYKDADGSVFHTYSTYARGLDIFLTSYHYLDITPKGRDEEQTGGLGWVRYHDRYDERDFVHPWMERPGITGPLPR